MLKSCHLFFLIFFSQIVFAQYNVVFKLKKLPPYHQATDSVYIAGSFNNWNPKQQQLIFKKDQAGIYTLHLPLQKGMYEYKLTKGVWETVESAEGGFPISNRFLEVFSDTIIELSVAHWADHFPKPQKRSTANVNVRIIDTAFYIPQLNRYRRIWIYLPHSYQKSNKEYPVLYMHDGQNVFDDSTSGYGEWGVDEALDTLSDKATEMIVVAIDNDGDKRLNEYSPFDMQKYGEGEGAEYVDFVAKTLRYYINKNYRTKKDARNTFIAGSSMGGIISFYAILKYPEVFGGAGVFSPAFWIVPNLKDYAAKRSRKFKGKIYFFAGMKESESMVPDMLAVFEEMNKKSKAKMISVIRAEGKHNEATWRQEFPLFYEWMVGKRKYEW